MKTKGPAEHIMATYVSLRIGMGVIALLFPPILWIGGHICAHLSLQPSMSAYYHAGGGAMRDEFVGILFAVGVFLYLYKGYTIHENYALNLAGLFAVLVAIFPMEWDCGTGCKRFTVHGTCAILFFLCIAYVCIFRASDTLSQMTDQIKIKRYRTAYTLLGVGMIASPAIAFILTVVLQLQRSIVFFVEATGVYFFATYWLVKSWEIASTNVEEMAIHGKLRVIPFHMADTFRRLPVTRVEQSDKQ